jgi:hypothetical protein
MTISSLLAYRRPLTGQGMIVILAMGDTMTRTFGCRYTCQGFKAEKDSHNRQKTESQAYLSLGKWNEKG